MNKEHLKKDGKELQDYLQFRRRGSRVEAKKGKGSFRRSTEKQRIRKEMVE